MNAIVIGAGASGLSAAIELLQNGVQVTLFEARDRVGGRILTRHSPIAGGLALDLGAEFVHGHVPEIFERFDGGKGLRHLKTEARLVDARGWSDAPDTDELSEKFLKTIDPKSPDQNVLSLWEKFSAPELEKRLLLNYIEGFNAADARVLSAHAFKHESEAAGADIMDAFRPREGGYDQLLAQLLDTFVALGGNLELNTIVDHVHWRDGEARVEVRDGSYKERSARAVFITVPVLAYAQMRFTPDIPDTLKAAGQIVMGHVYKPVLVFREPLWDSGRTDMQFVHVPHASFPVLWTWNWCDPFVITVWSAGGKALNLHGRSREEIIELALEAVAEVSGREIAELEGLLIEAHFHDWVTDPFSYGAYSYVKVGGEEARDHLSRPVANTLFFAGEATMNDGSAGTVHGAIRSGRRAARQFLQR